MFSAATRKPLVLVKGGATEDRGRGRDRIHRCDLHEIGDQVVGLLHREVHDRGGRAAVAAPAEELDTRTSQRLEAHRRADIEIAPLGDGAGARRGDHARAIHRDAHAVRGGKIGEERVGGPAPCGEELAQAAAIAQAEPTQRAPAVKGGLHRVCGDREQFAGWVDLLEILCSDAVDTHARLGTPGAHDRRLATDVAERGRM